MIRDLILNRINDYQPANAVEQESILSEILQHMILASLSRRRLFDCALFHGGTCLRILFGLQRFSEDLDFLLKTPAADFTWAPYLRGLSRDCADQGIELEIQNKPQPSAAVKKALLKTNSLGLTVATKLEFSRHHARKIKVKLEIDTNPPAGSSIETRYITFPVTAAVSTQDLASGFALKCHALLCRKYAKGRDWYDFLWYVGKRVTPNLVLLANALGQQGPWVGKEVKVTAAWFGEAMSSRIQGLDWNVVRDDVARFLPARECPSLALWGPQLFLQTLDNLSNYLTPG